MVVKITLLYAGLLGLVLTVLSFNVMYHWVRVTGAGQESDQTLRRAEKVLAHFIEYVPLSLILFALLEGRGTPPLVMHCLGGGLVVARVAHAFGSNEMTGANLLRFVGSQLTFLVLLVASLACIYVSFFTV